MRAEKNQIALGMVVLAMGLLLGAAPEKPTYSSAKADYDAGQYRPCLQKIGAVMALPETKRNPSDRYDLFMLRGECLLQLKSQDVADDAFHGAAMALKGQDDIKKVADAEAICILIKASPGLKYQPRDKTQPAIEIVPAESRKKAMLALLDDRLTILQPRIEAALKSDSLVPLHDLIPSFSDLYMLELAATGENQRTMALGKELGGRARDLIQGALKQISDRIQDLNMLANSPSDSTSRQIGFRGLNSQERDEIKGLADELIKIQTVSANARQMAKRMGGNVEAWEAILADVNDIKALAQKTYDRAY